MLSRVRERHLGLVEVSNPEIIYGKNAEDGSESVRLRYKVQKSGEKYFPQLNELIPEDYFEIEYINVTGKLPDFNSCPTSILMIPAFNFFFPLTFFWPVNLKIDKVDEDAVESVERFRSALRWVYNTDHLEFGAVTIGGTIKNKKANNTTKKLVMFSGGVDSYSAIAHNYKNMIIGSVEGLEANRGRNSIVTEPAMLVKRKEAERLAIALKTHASVLKVFPYKFISQNIATKRMTQLNIVSAMGGVDFVRDVVMHIPCISMYAPIAYMLDVDIQIGSAFEPMNQYQLDSNMSGQKNCASPELSDALVFGGRKFSEQDGLHQMRIDKLKDIINFHSKTKIDIKLIVCFSEDGSNDGVCKKCVRTQVGLLTLDENPRDWGFDGFSPSMLEQSIKDLNWVERDKEFVFDTQYHIESGKKYKIMNDFLHRFKKENTDDSYKKTISIITPCYNAEKYIHKLLNSILLQTHPNIEMVVVDDGSTDNSAEVIKSYIPKFNKRDYKLTYIYQDNQGQSVAVNNALKLVDGDYLVWPDADDYYADKNSIAKMAKALSESDDDVSMVRVQYNVLDESGQLLGQLGVSDDNRYKTDLFEDCVLRYGRGFWGAAGGYMAKLGHIDQMIPGREIYTEKYAGQNWQLCLPLLYKHRCITIEEYLYNVVSHDDSHSRMTTTNNSRQLIYLRTIENTLNKIPLDKDYRRYLMGRVKKMTEENITGTKKRPYRIYAKRAIKAVLPYGVIVAYKRLRDR